MKTLAVSAFAFAFAILVALGDEPTAPEVTDVTMAQDASRLVTVSYTLTHAPAIVTVDFETNGVSGWASIGGEYIQGLQGMVNRKVVDDGTYTITWRPDLSWNGHKITDNGARAVVKAWSLDNPPDYMIVDLAQASAERVRFYTDAKFVPGGIDGNDVYKTSKIAMRKMHARGVPWTMGSTKTHAWSITLDADYYIGVYEVTQGQAALVGGPTQACTYTTEGTRRPLDSSSFVEIRDKADNTISGASYYPLPPSADSIVGRFRSRAENLVDFELPSEAQWEFACGAGHGEGYWGNGKVVTGANADNNLPGRYAWNTLNPGATSGDAPPAEDRTNIVGSYEPNDWGLYDMHGNVQEFCLDWYVEDDGRDKAAGGVYTGAPIANGAYYPDGTVVTTKAWRVLRGGSFAASAPVCQSHVRGYDGHTGHTSRSGFRMVCPAVVK